MTRIAVRQAMRGLVRYRSAETKLSLQLVSPLPLQNLHVEMTNNTLSRGYELVTHQAVEIEEFRELFDCPLKIIHPHYIILDY
jgi:hypothetical protein